MSQTSVSQFRFRVPDESPGRDVHELENGRSVFIGSGDSCGVQLEGTGIAEIHCLVDVDDEGVSVQDWASDSGTLVNGNAIEDKTRLQPGDRLKVGDVEMVLDGSTASKNRFANVPAEPPRSESIGMETLGTEDSVDGEALGVSTALSNQELADEALAAEETLANDPTLDDSASPALPHAPVVNVPTGRLSDSFGAPQAESTADNEFPITIESEEASCDLEATAEEIETPAEQT
ncbi:MAG: FHA domain-containing protein, partial [Planctomycetota bacterium]